MASREVVKNSIRNLLDMTFLDDKTTAAPSVLGTAVSTVCNLSCPHCMRESLGVRENEFMDFDAWVAHRDELKFSRRISLYGLGEPFLHPRFFDFVKVCKEEGVEVSTSTHGMSLTSEVREKIIDLGIDELNISMEAADKELFEKLRAGAIFETVVEQVTALAELKKSRGTQLPLIVIHMTIMEENIGQIEPIVRLAHRMGAQAISFSNVVIYKAADAARNVFGTPEFQACLDRARRLSLKLGLPMRFWRQKPTGWEESDYCPETSYGCPMLWSDQIIERDGHMKLCCYIEESIADVFESGPAAAFNCDEIRSQRRALMEGRVRTECQGCVYLRERSPFWIQTKIDDAARRTRDDPSLSDEDRRELSREIVDVQKKKDALFPRHQYGQSDLESVASPTLEPAAVSEADLPVY